MINYYIYQADVYCQKCGEDICNRLKAEMIAAGMSEEEFITKFSDQHNYDSDEYPKECCDNGEADSPQHCGSHDDCFEPLVLTEEWTVGKFLENELTQDGYEYVKESLMDEPMDEPNELVKFWAKHYDISLPENDDAQSDDETGEEID